MRQILTVEHHDLILAFISAQVKLFDKFHRKKEKYAVDAETANRGRLDHAEGSVNPPTSSVSAEHVTVLGSKQKTRAIRELLEQGETDPMFTGFCSRISLVIQALSSDPADTIAINDSHQVLLSISLISPFVLYV